MIVESFFSSLPTSNGNLFKGTFLVSTLVRQFQALFSFFTLQRTKVVEVLGWFEKLRAQRRHTPPDSFAFAFSSIKPLHKFLGGLVCHVCHIGGYVRG